MITSAELQSMSKEMYAAHSDGNVAAKIAAGALTKHVRLLKSIEAGRAMPKSMERKMNGEIAEAIEMYNAAKNFVTPEPDADGKNPYPVWNGTEFEVRFW